MKRVVKEAMGDCSTVEEFRFLVRCQECGGIWHSSPIRFSKAGAEPESEGMRTILRTLYEREREAAREKAAAEAAEFFNYCPVCGRLVCDRCFLICVSPERSSRMPIWLCFCIVTNIITRTARKKVWQRSLSQNSVVARQDR